MPDQRKGLFQAEVVLNLFTYARPTELLSGQVNKDLLIGDYGDKLFGGSNDDLHLWVVTRNAPIELELDFSGPQRLLPTQPVSEADTVRQAALDLLEFGLGIYSPVKLRALDYLDSPSRAGSERVIAFPFWGVVDINEIAKVLGGSNQVGLEAVNSRGVLSELRDQFESERFDGRSRFGYRVIPDDSRGHQKYLPEQYRGRKILALDHDLITFYAWRRLRYAFDAKVDPFRILGVNPLGREFRLSDLQDFYEVSLGEHIQRDAFRRAMLDQRRPFIEEIGTDSSRQGKPAKVFRLHSWAEPSSSN